MATGVANAVKKYRRIQIGKEVTYGTEAIATRAIRTIDMAWKDAGTLRSYTPDYTIGRFTRRTDTPTITRTGVLDSTFSTDFSFEDILLPLSSMKGAVTAGAALVSGDFPWLYQVDPNTIDPLPDSYTIERRIGGSINYDRTALGTLIQSFTISTEMEGDVTKLEWTWWGQAPNNNAIAGPLSLPATFTPLSALGWKVYFDNTWGAMDVAGSAPSMGGGTQYSTTVTAMKYTYYTGLDPALYIGDGRTDPSKHRPMPRGSELELTVEYNANVEIERLAAIAGSKRYVRLLGEGARIGASGWNKTIMIQAAYVYPDGGFGEIGGSANEAETVTLKLESLPDDDTEDTEIRVINTISTFP